VNVFVLCTGRCGSLTFARACRQIRNYTVRHESRSPGVLDYPPKHIEVDNRLAWCLGRLAEAYPEAYYVHLLRNRDDVVRSFARRGIDHPGKILHGWIYAINQAKAASKAATPARLEREAGRMVDTVAANIRHFLRDKPHTVVWIESAADRFPAFWRRIAARGDLPAALAELKKRSNRGPAT